MTEHPLPRSHIRPVCVVQEMSGVASLSDNATANAESLRTALCDIAGNARWMLAHLSDGVLWGRFEQTESGCRLVLPTDTELDKDAGRVCPQLRPDTVEEIRLFGEDAEVLVWPTRSGLRYRRVTDLEVADADEAAVPSALDAYALLWGRYGQPVGDRFSYVDEGAEGFPQVLPLCLDGEGPRPFGENLAPALLVRTYLTLPDSPRDDAGGFRSGLDAHAYRLVDICWINPLADAFDA